MFLGFFWIACSSEEPPPSEKTEVVANFDGPSEPTRNLEDTISILTAGLLEGLPSSVTIRNTYESYMINRDMSCPSMENQASSSWTGVWFDNCISTNNYVFFGTSLFLEEVSEADDYWYFLLIASFELSDVNADPFIGGGEVEYERTFVDDHLHVTSRVGGTWQHSPSGGWMAQKAEASTFYDVQYGDNTSIIQIDGGVAYDDVQLSFTEMKQDDDVCDGLPQGRLRIRDDSGYWFRIDLLDCQACGSVFWRDNEMGERCVGDILGDAMRDLKNKMLE